MSLAGSKSYDPWGQPLATNGTQADLGYQGGWTDPTTGDVGTASRWYDPATASFTSRDTNPIDPTGTAIAANPFTYGNDDPLDQLDQTGLCASSGGSGHVSGSGGSVSGGGWSLGWWAGIGSAILGLFSGVGRAGGGPTGGSRGGEISGGGGPEDPVGVGGGNSGIREFESVSCVSRRLPSSGRLQGAIAGARTATSTVGDGTRASDAATPAPAAAGRHEADQRKTDRPERPGRRHRHASTGNQDRQQRSR